MLECVTGLSAGTSHGSSQLCDNIALFVIFGSSSGMLVMMMRMRMEINAGDDDDGDDSPSLLLPHNLREGHVIMMTVMEINY